MLIPIGDDNPVERFPFVNASIIIVNSVLFLTLAFRPDYPQFVKAYGLIPELFRPYCFLTHMFFHGSPWHLVGNMLFLAVVGKNVEDRVGPAGYLMFYILAGCVAVFLHIAFVSITGEGDVPVIGASGAVAGIMAAYAAFFPRNQIRFFYWIWFFWFGTFLLASAWAIGFWFVLQLVMSLLSFYSEGATGVAYWAHVGGFGAGLLVAVVFNRIVPRNEFERSIAILFAQGREDRAIERYERFRKKFPWRTLSPILQHEIADSYEQRGDISSAVGAYELFLKAHPDDAQASETREKLNALRGGAPTPPAHTVEKTAMKMPAENPPVEEAAADIEAIDPVQSSLSMGRLHFRDKSWDMAIEEFSKVVENDPGSIEAHAYLGVALYQKGIYTKAIEETRKAIELGGRNTVAYNNLALACLANGQREDAAEAWREVLNLDSRNKIARDGLKRLRAANRG